MRLAGTVRFPPGEPIEVRTVHVHVRDITEMDGPAETVASVDLPGTKVPATGLEVPFALQVDASDPRRIYALRAHADRTGSGEVDPGDLVTTTAYVVRAENGDRPVLELQPVSR